MSFRAILLYFLFVSGCLSAQWSDNFSDGNFTQNPQWTGDTGRFKINLSKQLQLFSSGSDSSFLLSKLNIPVVNSKWEFKVYMPFAPSANNFSRIYLMASGNNLWLPLNGYYLQFGEALSNDKIELFKQNGKVIQSIARGKIGIQSAVNATVKVYRYKNGNWIIKVDSTGSHNFNIDATGSDSTYSFVNSIGVACKYTSGNSGKFYFDDFYFETDTVIPYIDSLYAINNKTLMVKFNEEVLDTFAYNALNYACSGGLIKIATVIKDSTDALSYRIIFSDTLSNISTYYLQISNIQDMFHQTCDSSLKYFFQYHEIQPLDILINEIMFDPDPVNGLPNAEYIELYNKSVFDVNLSSLLLEINGNKKLLPNYVLKKLSYVVLTNTAFVQQFSFSNIAGISNMPALLNTGSELTIKSNANKLIHRINYNPDWYNDVGKSDGGWSIEMIDVGNACENEKNWKASINAAGGTPGTPNSVVSVNPDIIKPEILYSTVNVSCDTVTLFFNEALKYDAHYNNNDFNISNGIGFPLKVSINESNGNALKLALSQKLVSGTVYELTVQPSAVSDCCGNKNNLSVLKLGVPDNPLSGDVLINEIMYEPKFNLPEFIELYNNSEKIINLKTLLVATLDTATGLLTDMHPIALFDKSLFPSEYILLSKNGALIQKEYTYKNINAFWDMKNFPSLNNEGETIVLSTDSGKTIDIARYVPSMHYPLLKETRGVSLERVYFNKSSMDGSNWHSASSTTGHATPGYRNSQSINELSENEFNVYPKTFSPDNDGYDDLLTMHYRFDTPGYKGSVVIYNASGIMQKVIINNLLLSSEGIFVWDGINTNNERCVKGNYIVLFEVVDINGTVRRKKSIVGLTWK